MKQIGIVFIFILCILQNSVAQDLTSVFLSVPEDILFGVNAESRDKLIATPADSAKVIVQSVLDDDIVRDTITDDYIKIRTSLTGTLQIKVLPLVNNSKIVCVVKTVCGKACDSYTEFYTTDWKPLENVKLMPETTIDWFIKADADRSSEDFKNAYAALTMIPFKVELSPGTLSMEIYCDIKNYLSEEDYKKIEPFFTDSPQRLTWDKASFK